MRYRVWMHGSSMTASYDGYVDVFAENEEDAEYRAKRKITSPSGSFSDWSPSMFRVQKIERKGWRGPVITYPLIDKEEFKLIKLQCPECYSNKVVFVNSEFSEEDCFQCEDCNIVSPLSEMAWESEQKQVREDPRNENAKEGQK